MALIKSDRVKETSTSTGATTFALAGAGTGYRTFSSVCAIGDTFYYAISNQSNGEWEAGLGTYSALNTLTRTAVHSSSNSGNVVTFSAGTKEVFLTLTARHLDRINDNGQSTAIGSKTSVVAVNDSATLPDLDLQFSELKTLTAKYGPTPSYSRASTGTYFNASGVLTSAAVNEPRFDHVLENGVWVSKGLLIEEQRTNLAFYSSDYTNGWTRRGMTQVAGQSSPDGGTIATLSYPSGSQAYCDMYRVLGAAATIGQAYTISFIVKASGKNFAYISDINAANVSYFNLSTGTVSFTFSGHNPSIVSLGGGWYRCSNTTTAAGTTGHCYMGISDASGSTAATVNGTDGAMVFAGQSELGSFPTSYIPTVASSVTRSADVCQITGSAFTNLWNATEGTISLEQDFLSYSDPAADQRYFSIAGSSNAPAFVLNYDNGTNFFWYRNFSGLDQLVLPDVNSAFKVALAFRTNDYATVLNGGTPVTSSTKTLPTTFAKIDIGYQVGAPARSSWVQRLRYFRSRLDNTQLVNLSGGINTLAFKPVTGSGSVTVANEYSGINISVPNPLPITNGGTGAQTQLAAVTNLISNPPNDGGQYTLASKKTSGSPSFYWVDSTGYAPTLDLLFAADKSLTAYTGPTPSFSRASGGFYYNSSGLLSWSTYNFVASSENATHPSWNKINLATPTAIGTVAGTSAIAWNIAADTTNNFHRVEFVNAGSITNGMSFSFYAKANGETLLFCEIVCDAGFAVTFNLANGTFSTPSGGATATMTNVGNGWYKCSIYKSFTSSFVIPLLYPRTGVTAYIGDGTSGVLLSMVQLEKKPTPSDYVKTTGSANSAPRFNHVYNGSSWVSKGLLIEEQRTNNLLQSNSFSTTWVALDGAVVANSGTSPDGTNNAWKLNELATTTASHGIYQTLTIPGGACTWSIFAKAGERSWLQFLAYNSTTNFPTWFNLSNGTIGTNAAGNTATITPVGNGWYRCSLTRSAGATYAQIYTANGDNNASYLGQVGNGIYIYGAQVETGSFPTSYIPTTTAAVTRSADVCQITGADFSGFWNASEGSFAVEYDRLANHNAGNTSIWTLTFTNGSTSYIDNFAATPGGGVFNDYSSIYRTGSQQAAAFVTSLAGGVVAKSAVGWKINDFSASFNGGAVQTDNSVDVPVGINRLNIGMANSAYFLCGHIVRLRYYPTRLPNATLQVLST